MTKQLLYTKASVIKIDKETGAFEVIASTGDVDRDREVIDPKGWDLTNFKKNPIILWAHNYSELPIGVAEKIEMTDRGLIIKGRFASEEANPKAQQVKRLYEEGIQKAVSVGFIALERDPEDSSIITKAELLELSFVPVPSNPNSLALAMEKGFDPKKDPELFEKEKAEHIDNPICDPDSDQYDPEKCEELTREEKPKAKDVNEVIALAGVLDHLDFLIFMFGQNEVSENVLSMMREAQALLLKAVKAEATLGKKEFEIVEYEKEKAPEVSKAKEPETFSKPDIGQISESISERGRGQNTSVRADGSTKDDDVVSELSTTTIRELRKSTLETYHASENILSITKRVLESRKR